MAMYLQRSGWLAGILSGFVFLVSSTVLGQAVPPAGTQPESPAEKLTRLMERVNSAELTAEKSAAFEELAAFGTPEVVPTLIPLLSDEKLAHYARFALEANPAPSVDEAFRQSLDQLRGNLLIGVISSIGVRKDAQAVTAVAAKLADADVAIAAAAANALGSIATPEAGDLLAARLASAAGPHRAAVARGCVVCAENLKRAGATEQSIALYDLVRGADVPQHIRLAGLRGAILARGLDGLALMVEQLKTADDVIVDVALRTARELPSEQVVPALIGSLQGLRPVTAGRVILTLGDLGDITAAPVVAAALASDVPEVRVAAIRSLRKIGDARVIPALWAIAVGPDAPLAEVAKETLAALPGPKSDEAVAAKLDSTPAASRLLALELVGQRRITASVPQLTKLATSSDAAIKSAAVRALGETVSLEQMSVLVKWVIAARGNRDKAETQTALTAACVRMPDRDACAHMLTDKMATAPADAKTVLLEQLGAMGGSVALTCLADSAKDASPDTQDAATRILGTWIGSDVGPVLLELARTIGHEKYKIRVLRGYIRIASQFGLPHDEKMDMCEKALSVAQRDDERDLVLDVLARDPSPIALRIAITQLDNKAIQAKTAGVAVGIAQTAIQDNPQVVAEAMQRVIRAGVGGDIEVRAKAYLERAQSMDQNGVTSVKLDGRLLLEYRSQPNPMKLYVSKLFTPQGTQVLRDSPHDHVHHHSLMYAIGIDGVDFWSEVPAQDYGRQVPAGGIRTSDAISNGLGKVTIEQIVNWENPRSELLAVESRVITAHVGVVDSASLLTWAFTLTPTERKPQVELWGRHYFGLGMRFVESMDTGSTFVTSANEEGVVVQGTETLTRATWCAFHGNADGKPVTVAMFDAPGNPRHPATWFTMTAPFAYLSATMNLTEKLTISRDQPLKAKYGVAMWDGTVDKVEIERVYQAWREMP